MFAVVGLSGRQSDDLADFAPLGAAGVWATTGLPVILGLSAITFLAFAVWVSAFLAFCFAYGIKRSNPEPYPRGNEP